MVQSIKDEIRAAFAAVTYPGDDTVSVPGAIESTWIESNLVGRRWQDITLEDLIPVKEALPILSPGAFAYFLPAYMINSLAEDDMTRDVSFFVEFALTHIDREHNLRRYSLLTQQQCCAVCSFMRWVLDLEDDLEEVQNAYNRYWLPRCQAKS